MTRPGVPEPRQRLMEPLDGAGWMQGVGVVVGAAAFHGAGNLGERPGFGVDTGRVREGPESFFWSSQLWTAERRRHEI